MPVRPGGCGAARASAASGAAPRSRQLLCCCSPWYCGPGRGSRPTRSPGPQRLFSPLQHLPGGSHLCRLGKKTAAEPPSMAPTRTMDRCPPPGHGRLCVWLKGEGKTSPQRNLVPAQAAPGMVAIPVREASEPSERLQPIALSAPTPVSARYTPTEGRCLAPRCSNWWRPRRITALVRELALQSQLVARDGAHWLLRVERESLNQPTARERLRARWRLLATPRRSA